MGQRRVESGVEIEECSPDLQFVLHCSQEGLSEVGNWKHLEGTAIEEDQQTDDQATCSEMNHRKPPPELASKVMIMSRYERVFTSLDTDGILVKLSKIPGGTVGPS